MGFSGVVNKAEHGSTKDPLYIDTIRVAPGFIAAEGALYLKGADNLWHKFSVDADGIWGETAAPQAGAPPF